MHETSQITPQNRNSFSWSFGGNEGFCEVISFWKNVWATSDVFVAKFKANTVEWLGVPEWPHEFGVASTPMPIVVIKQAHNFQ